MKGVSSKREIEDFKMVLGRIGERDGWTLGDLKERFSKGGFDGFVFNDVVPAGAVAPGRAVAVVGVNKVSASAPGKVLGGELMEW